MGKSFLNKPGYPLGLRNNNPGNIRPGDSWRGMTGTNQGFVVFQDCSWGIRAIAVDLTTKIKNGYNTITKIITRYAPPSDNNNTAGYIASMVAATGYGANQVLYPDTTTLQRMIRGIINVEVGPSYSGLIDANDIAEGVSMINSVNLPPAAAVGITLGGAALLGLAVYLVASADKVKVPRRQWAF